MMAGLDPRELLELAVLLIAVGALSGFLAGLFGIGGGAILVPVFYECFRLAGVPLEVRMPLCIGTSLAVIIPTSISGTLAASGTFNLGTSPPLSDLTRIMSRPPIPRKARPAYFMSHRDGHPARRQRFEQVEPAGPRHPDVEDQA